MTSAFETVAMDWCEVHGGYVDPGTTRPYTGSKLYRACADCIAQMEQQRDAAYRDAGFDQMTPLEQRYMDGDR